MDLSEYQWITPLKREAGEGWGTSPTSWQMRGNKMKTGMAMRRARKVLGRGPSRWTKAMPKMHTCSLSAICEPDHLQQTRLLGIDCELLTSDNIADKIHITTAQTMEMIRISTRLRISPQHWKAKWRASRALRGEVLKTMAVRTIT